MAFLFACLCFFSANLAYQEADRWFYWATYKAECVPSGPPGCAELKLQEQPNWPYGIEVKNKDVLLAEASALHNTGSAVLSLGGLLMAASSVLIATNAFGSSFDNSPRESMAKVVTTCAKVKFHRQRYVGRLRAEVPGPGAPDAR